MVGNMPIARINPDGTVKIYNSKTGETKDVPPEELGQYSPKMVGEYYKLAGEGVDPTEELKNTKAKKELADIKSGAISGAGGDEGTATERALKKKAQVALDALGRVEDTISKNPNIVAQKSLPGAPGARGYEADISSLIDVLGNLRTGATITPQQQTLYENMLPKVGDSAETKKNKLAAIRSELQRYAPEATNAATPSAEQFPPESIVPGPAIQAAQQRQQQNQQQGPTGLSGLAGAAGQAAGPLSDLLFGNVKNVIPKTLENTQRQAARPSAKGDLKKSAEYATSDLMDMLKVAVPAGVDIGSLFGGKGLLMGGKKIAGLPKKGVEAIGEKIGGKSIEVLGQARDEVAKGITVKTESLLKAGDDYVKNIDPEAAKVWETLKPSIKATTSAPELLQKITNWGDKAYTNSGDKRAITAGLLKDRLYQAGRGLLKDQAPDVAALTTKMAKRKGFEGGLKRYVYPTAIGAGVGAGVSIPASFLINKLFGK